MDHGIERDRKSGVVAEDHHPQRIANQKNVDAGPIQQTRHGCVVSGEHGDLFATPLLLFQVRDSNPLLAVSHSLSRFPAEFL
jgi:hypothetical protein